MSQMQMYVWKNLPMLNSGLLCVMAEDFPTAITLAIVDLCGPVRSEHRDFDLERRDECFRALADASVQVVSRGSVHVFGDGQ